MPSVSETLFLIHEAVTINLFYLFRANDADLVILSSQSSAGIADGVNVKLGGGWFSRELSQTLCQLFLKIVVQIILLSEENHASLGDCMRLEHA